MTETPDTPMAQPIQYEPLVVTRTPDGPRIDTAPLPEHIGVSPELWDQATQPAEAKADDWLWLEEIGHQDPDIENDGWMLHIDAVNVTCAYQLLNELPDGTRVLVLRAWGER